MKLSQYAAAIMASVGLLTAPVLAQTFSACNPLHQTSCPANPALGRSINVDFRNGGVDSFEAAGGPVSYESDGVHFTVSQPGYAPQLISRFHIMFGHISVRMRAAPGAGIVSSLVLQSDTLDEIDYEWIGVDTNEVQSNYFGKGDTSTWTRGGFHATPGDNTKEFITYEIEWTAEQVVWSINGSPVRVLTPATAQTNQYPQTPMQLKFGAWSAGSPGNAQGTIEWAKGPTDFANGPFSMIVESIQVKDYSTGSAYQYNGNSGNADSIVAVGGQVGGNQGSSSGPSVVTPVASESTTGTPVIPPGIGYSADPRSGWPYVTTASGVPVAAPSPTYAVQGVPSGWIVSSNGKIVPISSAVATPTYLLQPYVSASPSSPPQVTGSGYECEFVSVINEQGFPTTSLLPVGWTSMSKNWDEKGFAVQGACNATLGQGAAAASGAVLETQRPELVYNGRADKRRVHMGGYAALLMGALAVV